VLCAVCCVLYVDDKKSEESRRIACALVGLLYCIV
jgi:hypothetical protein